MTTPYVQVHDNVMPPYVLLDVDGVCVDYYGRPMPGIERLVEVLRLLGFEIVLWSGGGAVYARKVAAALGFLTDVKRCYDKPDYPIQFDAALALLGRPPALQVDDDPTERVGDWPFLLVTEAADMARYQWSPRPVTRAQEAVDG